MNIFVSFQDVFELIVASFKGLSETSSPHFERRVNILEAVASYRSCVVMLDIDCHDLIQEMFQIFFATVGWFSCLYWVFTWWFLMTMCDCSALCILHKNRMESTFWWELGSFCSEEPKFVMMYMKTIMCLVLEESEEIPDRLLELLLGNLMRGKKVIWTSDLVLFACWWKESTLITGRHTCFQGVSKAGNTLAREVVEKCAETLGPYLEAFLSSIMSEGKPSKSRWLESYHDLIFEIYTCAPSLLASSISKLTDELLVLLNTYITNLQSFSLYCLNAFSNVDFWLLNTCITNFWSFPAK